MKLGLERMETLLAALDRPDHRFCSVHVAGTNGKGSVCAMIESGLRHKGLSTGLYTSPHLVSPTERIRIGGKPVSEDLFSSAFSEVHAVAEALLRRGAIDLHPTYFETVTAMAFLLFSQARVNTAVIEVGLGGRLDATNVITPALSVITPVDFDHMQYLGATLARIAGEKAGIIKPGVPVVTSDQHPEALWIIEEQARAQGSPLARADDWRIGIDEQNALGATFTLRRGGDILPLHCALPGDHQIQNARTAAVALRTLGCEPREIHNGIAQAQWPGRLELVHRQPDVFLDGAHNAAGARALAHYLRKYHEGRRIWLLFGIMRDKQIPEVTGPLFPLAHRVVLTRPDQERSAKPDSIGSPAGAVIVPDAKQALAQVLSQAAADDLIVVTGSLFLVGELRPLFRPAESLIQAGPHV